MFRKHFLVATIIFIFNSKAANCLATNSTFLAEVFKPLSNKTFVKCLIDKSRKSSYFPIGILN